MKVVLFVDDEKLITRALSLVFDDNQNKYVFVNSGSEALNYLSDNPVDLLCTDIVMPEMDGFELLERVQEKHPSVTRIALSSFHKPAQTKRLIDENLAQYFFFKPWDDNELKRNIYKILNMQASFHTKEMLSFIDGMPDLPTIPRIYSKLTSMIKDDSPIEDIAKVVESDQSTAATVLRIANSAFYGRKTGTISKAIMNIGLDNLKSIILTHSVFETMTPDVTTLKDMWEHAILANKLMHLIYKECLGKNVSKMFASAGLLHDIGKLIFLAKDISYMMILQKAERDDLKINDIEKEHFGVCHQDLGGYLLNSWDLPFAYVEAAMFHHRPLDYRIINRELVAVVYLAHYYAEIIADNRPFELDEKVFKILNLDRDVVEEVVKGNF